MLVTRRFFLDLFRHLQMGAVSCVADQKRRPVRQRNIIPRIPTLQLVHFKITVQRGGPGVQPGIVVVYPVIWYVYPRLRTRRAK
jgi:hypothetical protein